MKLEYNREEYKKRKVIPTRLPYRDKYPSSELKESKSIEFLRNFNFKKKKERE